MPLALMLISSLEHRNKDWQWLRWKQHPFCLIPQLAFFLPFSQLLLHQSSQCNAPVSLFLLPGSLCLTSPQRQTYTATSPWYSRKPKEREMQMSDFTVINPRKINLILNGSAHNRWVRGSWPPFFFFSVPTFISHWWLGWACAGAHTEPSLILPPRALETQSNHIQLALA